MDQFAALILCVVRRLSWPRDLLQSEDSGDYEPVPGCCPPEDEDLPTFQPPSDEEEAEAQEADTEDTQEDAASVKSC